MKNGSVKLTPQQWVHISVCLLVVASFILLFGFYEPLVSPAALHIIQILAFIYFFVSHAAGFIRAKNKLAYARRNWFQIPLLLALVLFFILASQRFFSDHPVEGILLVLNIYLIVQVVDSVCRFIVKVAATGRNPMRTFVLSFIAFIIIGAIFLKLPTFHKCEQFSFVDACFTTTSAVCVTGLIVKDTGSDFTILGQFVILTLMQLGGLGIIIFGAIFALLFGKAFSVQESVALQDLLSTETVGRIKRMIGFIFAFTIIAEALGAAGLWGMWELESARFEAGRRLFCSIFHSVSAFCNAGFSLFTDSFTSFKASPQIYAVVCPLIILGGLGFTVLYNISEMTACKIRNLFRSLFIPPTVFNKLPSGYTSLQTKIAVWATLALLAAGTAGYITFGYIFETCEISSLKDAFFMSVTTRTAGFNTIEVAQMSEAGKLFSIILMLIGGSPGSAAGGMKTVTLVVIILAVLAAVTKKKEVEAFRRSVRTAIIGRAITVAFFYITAYIIVVFGLMITERSNSFEAIDLMFEGASALATVGLSSGITSELSVSGKVLLIFTMLLGRLGPLTILSSLLLRFKTAKYNYPEEPLIIG
ncbi:TrkH family potassium uptake protein [Sedimentisphaera salicampi]|uniref:Ktr system potassium uptake protein B n=1 Tax=Sedimentisphaera salicampi TaxID=1941349 RepID=A0A1W6LJY6_9BACT|nr:potassium transporter TrkG [Sedimentisphaera salicampi]ARN56062.1 Ktr system potassium uptake protein B [Sedimentisphaera salicampi]OXU15794.1 Ktr system potassium uptake protein B [Sedimentisphaera salicampi]